MRILRKTGVSTGHVWTLVTVGSVSMLAACAPASSPPPTGNAPATAVPAAASAKSPFDGLYSGQVSVTSNIGGGQCNPGQPIIVVSKGAASRLFGQRRIYAPISPDGAFSAQSGTAYLSGTIQDGKMEAVLGNEYCRMKFSLTKG